MVICFIGTKGKESSPSPLPGWQRGKVLQEGSQGLLESIPSKHATELTIFSEPSHREAYP